ncbi:MAG: DUF6812 domain-containing protein [Candidatus Kariarchaeaceae archaeon]|jgi:hypothetical protein
MMRNEDDTPYRSSDKIQKRRIPVVLQTTKNLIRGTFHAKGMKRIIDELGMEEIFVAITDAKIFNYKEGRLVNTGFVAVNRKKIVWITPEEDIFPKEGNDSG